MGIDWGIYFPTCPIEFTELTRMKSLNLTVLLGSSWCAVMLHCCVFSSHRHTLTELFYIYWQLLIISPQRTGAF